MPAVIELPKDYSSFNGTTPTMDTQTTSGSFTGFLGGLLNSFASGYGQGLGTRSLNSGRQPGAEQFANPFQPNTAATQQTTAAQSNATVSAVLPYVLLGGGLLVAALLVKSLTK
jgi:hypothetical protein